MVPGLYVITNLAVSFRAGHRLGWRYLTLLPFVFAILHISWGIGFWAGLAVFIISPTIVNSNRSQKQQPFTEL
jgi:hypothetical protein